MIGILILFFAHISIAYRHTHRTGHFSKFWENQGKLLFLALYSVNYATMILDAIIVWVWLYILQNVHTDINALFISLL